MKFEKVNDDKIKITLSTADLEANDIDFHSFMANSNETQSLFLTVLDKAERDYGFSTDNYQLKVETIALDNGTFILTITRSRAINDRVSSDISKKKFKISRKVPSSAATSLIYKFNTFEDFCSFVETSSSISLPNLDKVSKTSMLYCYDQCYYLVFNNVNMKYPNLKVISSTITEFATYINYSAAFVAKLHEAGTLVIKDHVFRVFNKYFV